MIRGILLLLVLAVALPQAAQQTELRLNPELGEEAVRSVINVSAYPFVKAACNDVQLNGADWSALRRQFEAADSQIVSIVHIGDSHVQSEGNTSRVRGALQSRFGSAGRGLVSPLRLAGTNSPSDYSLRSETRLTSSRLMKKPWNAGMGMTGVAIAPAGERLSLMVSARQPFDRLRIHSVGDAEVEPTSVDGGLMAAYISPVSNVTEVLLTRAVTEATLHLRVPSGTSVCALELIRGDYGVEYSAIGNNGATFSAYSSIQGFGASVARLRPSLIVISLGTNEAFGRFDETEIRGNVASLIEELRRQNPEAVFLLTTPQECYRRRYTYTRRHKGRRRRRVSSYAVNPNIERVREVILDYAAEHHIAVWDWYEISGGEGSVTRWLTHGLMNKDRIHLTWDGYHLQGDMLADALMRELLKKTSENNPDDAESVR